MALKDDYRIVEAWCLGYAPSDAADELGLDPILVADAFEALDGGW